MGVAASGEPVHVVVGSDGQTAYMITAYHPNADVFESDLKTRKKR